MAQLDQRTVESTAISIDAECDKDNDESRSELASLKSSIYNYSYSNGRRYHAYHAGSYWGPNDEKAMTQLDIGHHLYILLLEGRLHLAPIGDKAERVLDVGTGTGIWAIDFADQYPCATVIGTDLSPIQPTWVPPNLSFEISDCCDEWTFEDDSFDFIHVRGLYGCVADWDAFYQEVYRSLKPGAYVEHVEQSMVPKSEDGTTDGTIFERWGEVSLQAGDAFGKSLRVVDESGKYMARAGLEDVTERRFRCPVGGWPKNRRLKELGLFNRLQWEEGIEGWSMMLLTMVLGWTREEVEEYLNEVRHGLQNPNIHAYQEITVVFGRKPKLGQAEK